MKIKLRHVVLFTLVNIIILIQVGIAIFFYNEYFNGKKLQSLQTQIQLSNNFKNLTNDSRKELLNAQGFLRQYLLYQKPKELQSYFNSLNELTISLERITRLHPELKKEISEKDLLKLQQLKTLIDSTETITKKTVVKVKPYQLSPYNIKDTGDQFDIEIHKTVDTIAKKGLFSRLKKAVKGESDVQKEIIFITTKNGNFTDTKKIKSDFDSIITSANDHYAKEIENFQSNSKIVNKKDTSLYPVFDKFITMSSSLMEIYTNAIDHFNEDLRRQYEEQNSKNNSIRANTVFGLMILMIFLSIIVIYLTKQSFSYEKKLKKANEIIRNNLNFKNRILSLISHEMRAPMQIMSIFLDRIGKISKDEKVLQYLRSVQFTNRSLIIQADQIMEYGNNQDRKMVLKPSEFYLKEKIDALLKAFTVFIESKNNNFTIQMEIEPEIQVFTDFTKITQIFTNVLSNANKFTENGTISVLIKATVKSEIVHLSTTISDTGIGISTSDLKEIFEPYYQGIVSEKVENFGVGLGLNLCKEIAEIFDGSIDAKSELGVGTQISFTLNLKQQKHERSRK